MNKTQSEQLIVEAYKMEAHSNQSKHDKYLGFVQCLKILARTHPALRKMMQSEGLIN